MFALQPLTDDDLTQHNLVILDFLRNMFATQSLTGVNLTQRDLVISDFTRNMFATQSPTDDDLSKYALAMSERVRDDDKDKIMQDDTVIQHKFQLRFDWRSMVIVWVYNGLALQIGFHQLLIACVIITRKALWTALTGIGASTLVTPKWIRGAPLESTRSLHLHRSGLRLTSPANSVACFAKFEATAHPA
eukprot:1914924-Amphidinium_carterae.1